MSAFPENKFRDEPLEQEDLHDVSVHDVTLGPDGGGGASPSFARTASTTNNGAGTGKKWYKKPVVWCGAACVVVFVIVLSTIIALAGGGKGGSSGSASPAVGTELPPPEVTETKLEQNRNALAAILLPRYTERGIDMAPVSDPESFQGRALEYVAGAEIFDDLSPEQNVERYAAVVFYLYTFKQPHLLNGTPQDWKRGNNWLTNEVLCLWEGVECNVDELVTGIILKENEMSGVLPLELSLFDNLAKLDFSSNLLYMDEDNHGLWSLLPNLRELIMDDNYFISETGIPVQFADLTSIEKISLSFNLLQGTFDEQVFGSMTTLVHFEAESNYIAGALPDNFLKLPDLTYVYVRRNSLEFALADILQDGNLPSLFALWLDGNSVSGPIPASIGLFTGLASFSVTDAQLTGPLPNEMVNLVDLQRLWLYDNQLNGAIPEAAAAAWTKLEVFEVYGNDFTGTMPQPICTAVTNSEYELKVLSADCQELSCECCTDCY